jgi:iron complex outermembrane recepter protein
MYERVDVLKGTSGVLFGVAAPGGVVNYVRKKPQFESAIRIDSALGSFDLARTSLDATGSLGDSDTVAYRLIVTGNTGKQTVHGDDDGSGFEDDFFIVNPQMTWLMPGGGSVNVSYEYNEMNRAQDFGIKRLNSGEILFGRRFVSPDNTFETEQHIGTIEVTQPLLEGWTLSLGAKAIRADVDSTIDTTFFGPLDGSLLPRVTAQSVADQSQEEFRIRIDGQFFTGGNIKHQLTFGFNYLQTETDFSESPIVRNTEIDPFNPVLGPRPLLAEPQPLFVFGSDPEKRIFLQDYVSIGEKLSLFGGVSYLEFREGTNDIRGTVFGEDEDFVWHAGAIYNHNAWLNPFFSFSTSLESQRGRLAGGGLVPSRTGEQMELGLKSEWFDRRLATTVSLFHIEQTNIAESDPNNPPGTSFFDQDLILVGDQRTRGFEFEAVGSIADHIRIIGGYSYLDAEFTRSTTAVEGNTPHSVPEHKFSLFTEYAFTGELQGWSAGLGFIHESSREGDNANTFQLPDYERVDLTLAYQRGPFNFRASVENVFDENYIAGSGRNAHRLVQGSPRFFTLSAGWEM